MTIEPDYSPAPYPESPETRPHAEEFPWPPYGERSLLTALIATWRESTFHPAEFYRKLPPKGLAAAVGYYLIIGVLTEAIRLFWGSVFYATGIDGYLSDLTGRETAGPMERLVDFLLSPLWLIITLFVVAGIIHLFVVMLVPQRRAFESTVRVFAYSYSPMLLTIVPFLGGVIGTVWSLVLVIIGLREVHNTTTGRALSATLLPLLIIAFVGAFLAIMVGLVGLQMAR